MKKIPLLLALTLSLLAGSPARGCDPNDMECYARQQCEFEFFYCYDTCRFNGGCGIYTCVDVWCNCLGAWGIEQPGCPVEYGTMGYQASPEPTSLASFLNSTAVSRDASRRLPSATPPSP
jgi:hypothetical protein